MAAKRDEAVTVNITLRIKEDLRQALEESAKARGVSLNAELAARLEHTRDRSSLTAEVLSLAFGKEAASLLVVLGTVMHVKGLMRAGVNWANDPDTLYAVMDEAVAALKDIRPGATPEHMDEMMWSEAGFMASTLLPGADLLDRIGKLIDERQQRWRDAPKQRRK